MSGHATYRVGNGRSHGTGPRKAQSGPHIAAYNELLGRLRDGEVFERKITVDFSEKEKGFPVAFKARNCSGVVYVDAKIESGVPFADTLSVMLTSDGGGQLKTTRSRVNPLSCIITALKASDCNTAPAVRGLTGLNAPSEAKRVGQLPLQ